MANLTIGLTRDDTRHINYLKRHYGMTITTELIHMLLKSAYDMAVSETKDRELDFAAKMAAIREGSIGAINTGEGRN